MKESKTVYSYLIEHMDSPSFKKVRELACDFVRKLPKELCDELHNSLNRGVDILDSEALLQMYFYSFGEMHAAKLNYAFEHLQQYIIEAKKVELVDYGCGQGMASMCYHDFINKLNPLQEITRVTLIEPSALALSRASLLCSNFYPKAEIVTLNKGFEDLTKKDFESSDSIPTIHLFSNILDVESYNIEKFAQLIKSISVGDNEYVIVSPIQNINRVKRLKDFVSILNNNRYFEQYLDKHELREDKEWTCAVLMCSSRNEKYDSICDFDSEVAEKYFAKDWEASLYSEDGKRLIFVDEKCTSFIVKEGTEIICDGAFQDCELVSDIKLPNSIKVIGNNSFRGCKSLKRIEIPQSVRIIKDGAFKECDSLSEIVIPKDIEFIGNNPFPKCKIICNSKEFVIDNDALFTHDKKLLIGYYGNHSIFCIPEIVEKIGNEAFAGNNELIKLVIPNSVVDIGDRAFMGVALNEIVLPQSLINIGDEAFMFSCLENITIPKSVKTIGRDSLASVKSISFEGSVEQIGSWIWVPFTTIENIDIPRGTQTYYERILPKELHTCLREATVSVEELNLSASEKELLEAWIDDYGVKYSKDGKKLLTIPSFFPYSSYHVKDGTEIICDNAFKSVYPKSHYLKEIVLPKSLLHIGNSAFLWSQRLESVELPLRLKSIGNYAFAACGKLKSINIPNGVKFLGTGCFNNCGIDKIVIPESVEKMSGSPINKKWTDIKIICNSNKFKIKNNCLYTANEKTILATFDKNNIDSSLLKGINHIGGYAFAFCNVEELTIPTSVKSIGDSAFYDSKIERIKIPTSVVSIGEYALSHTKIKEIVIPETIEILNRGVFSWCKQLERAKIPIGLKIIEDEVFSECEELEEIELPNTISRIGNNAFYGCKSLKRMLLQDGIRHIGNHVFNFCKNLNTIVIPSTISFIGENPFEGCYSTILSYSSNYRVRNGILYSGDYKKIISCLYNSDEIDLPRTVEEIGRSAFSGCFNLRKVSLPNTLKRIGSYAFSGCSSLKSITIPKSVISIENSLFLNCIELEEIRFRNKDVKLDLFQFADGCDSLKVVLIPKGSYSCYFDIFVKHQWLRDLLVEGTNKSVFNAKDYEKIIEEQHKNTQFGVTDLEQIQ